MTLTERLVSLLIILGFALFIAFLMGKRIKIPWKKTLGYPLYSVFKQELIRFQFLVAQSAADAIEATFNPLKKNQK